MRKTSTSSSVLQKLATALEQLGKALSFNEYRKWNSKEFSRMHEISNTFATVAREMKLIIPNPEGRGEYKLGDRMLTVRPSTVLKYLNEYQRRTRVERTTKRGRPAKPVQRSVKVTSTAPAPTLETYLIALKEQARKEVLQELLAELAKK